MSSTGLLEFLVVQFLASEPGHSHVSRLIRQILMAKFAWALLHNSVVERFWLIELFSVLRSVLIGVSVPLSSPTGIVPER